MERRTTRLLHYMQKSRHVWHTIVNYYYYYYYYYYCYYSAPNLYRHSMNAATQLTIGSLEFSCEVIVLGRVQALAKRLEPNSDITRCLAELTCKHALASGSGELAMTSGRVAT